MTSYWDNHGIFLLFFITIFPRLTLLFSSIAFGGFFWWIGFIFAPRILVAVLATMSYIQTNPVLVIISWLVALSGESTEKYTLRNKVRTSARVTKSRASLAEGEVLDADYTRIQ
ncbi:MAG: hypothetical protein IT287_04895 [Bdellovibrionaceae bacterium]|nr:hypothetical protein [Pseudobdellovibrionaceae bacterium]